jgi:hypothetical protein
MTMARFRIESGCLNEHDVVKMKDLPQFDVDIHAFNTIITRKMAKIVIKDQAMYADTITGTLYKPKTGKSTSSRLRIEKVYKL